MLRVICGLRPPNKISGYAYARIQEILMFGYFHFQPIKKQRYPFAEDGAFSRTCRDRGQGQGLQNESTRTSWRTSPLSSWSHFFNKTDFEQYLVKQSLMLDFTRRK